MVHELQSLAPGIFQRREIVEPVSMDVLEPLGAPGIFRLNRLPLPPVPQPLLREKVCHTRLAPSYDRTWFNASIIRHQERLLLAYRTGRGGSNLHVAEVDEHYRVRSTTPIPVHHPFCAAGREDPRLFTHRDRLHCAFVGVEFIGPQRIRTSMLLTRLRDDLSPEEVWCPEYRQRAGWEKNWTLFEYCGELFCVYSIQPHIILHLHGHDAYPFCATDVKLPWSGGLLRGGAPPILVGDEFYHFFHGRTPRDGVETYNTGLVTFEATPPFRPRRITPRPLLWPDPTLRQPEDWANINFVCGAVLEGGIWKLSMGVQDRSIEIVEFDAVDVERSLIKI